MIETKIDSFTAVRRHWLRQKSSFVQFITIYNVEIMRKRSTIDQQKKDEAKHAKRKKQLDCDCESESQLGFHTWIFTPDIIQFACIQFTSLVFTSSLLPLPAASTLNIYEFSINILFLFLFILHYIVASWELPPIRLFASYQHLMQIFIKTMFRVRFDKCYYGDSVQ